MKLLQDNPLLKIFPFWIIGLIAGLTCNFSENLFFYINLFFSGLLAFFILLSFFKEKHLKKYIIFLLPIWIFFISMYYGITNQPRKTYLPSDKYMVFSGIITERPKEKKNTFQCIIETTLADTTDSTGFENIPRTRILLYIKKDTNLRLTYGDRIIFRAMPQLIKNKGNPFEFDQKKYWKQKNVFYTVYVQDYKILSGNNANPLIFYALQIREKLLHIYHDYGFKKDEFAVLSALTLGYKDEINFDLRKKFANTGAMHILAVSGLHVGIIYLILNFLLSFFDKRKKLLWIKPLVTILFLWIFAFITGLSPSVMRASLMFSLFSFGKIINRKYFIYNAMIASAIILLTINPLQIFSVGFQLSYAAVFAIVTFQPGIYGLLKTKNKITDFVWSLTAVTLAAQIGTLPLGLYYFHQFPNYFFLTNIVVIPLASIILYGAVALLSVSFFTPLGILIARILQQTIRLLIFSVNFIDSFPYAVSRNIIISPLQALLLYVLLFSFALVVIKRKKAYLFGFLIALPVFMLTFGIKKQNIPQIVIFNIPQTSVLTVTDRQEAVVIASQSFIYDNQAQERYLDLFFASEKIKKTDYFNFDNNYTEGIRIKNFFIKRNFLQIFNKKFFIIDDYHITKNIAGKKPKVDYVILRNNVYLKIKEISDLVDFDTIIFDSSNKESVIKRWQEQCKADSIAWYSVPEQGAKIIKID